MDTQLTPHLIGRLAAQAVLVAIERSRFVGNNDSATPTYPPGNNVARNRTLDNRGIAIAALHGTIDGGSDPARGIRAGNYTTDVVGR